MATATLVKKLPLIKTTNDGIKKALFMTNDGNYSVEKTNIATGVLIGKSILDSDLFDINQTIEYFTNF